MIVKKSYYDILVYLIKNTAMKARPVAGDEHGIWQCWVPELEKLSLWMMALSTMRIL